MTQKYSYDSDNNNYCYYNNDYHDDNSNVSLNRIYYEHLFIDKLLIIEMIMKSNLDSKMLLLISIKLTSDNTS